MKDILTASEIEQVKKLLTWNIVKKLLDKDYLKGEEIEMLKYLKKNIENLELSQDIHRLKNFLEKERIASPILQKMDRRKD